MTTTKDAPIKEKRKQSVLCDGCGEECRRRSKCKHCGELRCAWCIHHSHQPRNHVTS